METALQMIERVLPSINGINYHLDVSPVFNGEEEEECWMLSINGVKSQDVRIYVDSENDTLCLRSVYDPELDLGMDEVPLAWGHLPEEFFDFYDTDEEYEYNLDYDEDGLSEIPVWEIVVSIDLQVALSSINKVVKTLVKEAEKIDDFICEWMAVS